MNTPSNKPVPAGVSDDLVEAYEVLSELTAPLCAACPSQQEHRCCYREACEITFMTARAYWNTELKPDGDTLPFLTDGKGCSVAPHLRPHCTGYLCPEALAQATPEQQQEYVDLRGYIARLGQPAR